MARLTRSHFGFALAAAALTVSVMLECAVAVVVIDSIVLGGYEHAAFGACLLIIGALCCSVWAVAACNYMRTIRGGK